MSAQTSIRGCSGVPLVCKSAVLGAPKTWWGSWDLGWGFPISAWTHSGSLAGASQTHPGTQTRILGAVLGQTWSKLAKCTTATPPTLLPSPLAPPNTPSLVPKSPPHPTPKSHMGPRLRHLPPPVVAWACVQRAGGALWVAQVCPGMRWEPGVGMVCAHPSHMVTNPPPPQPLGTHWGAMGVVTPSHPTVLIGTFAQHCGHIGPAPCAQPSRAPIPMFWVTWGLIS